MKHLRQTLARWLISMLSKPQVKYIPRYSDTDDFDKQGRWARIATLNNIEIAWINKINASGEIVFTASCNFPTKKNSGTPNESKTFGSFEEAALYVEDRITYFIKTIT